MPNNSSSTGNNTKGDDQYYIELGNQGINKITTDLKNGNVQIQQAKMSAGEAVLTSISVGLNTNGIITSCLNFLECYKTDTMVRSFGTAIGKASLAVGLAQTVVVLFNDKEISAADVVGILSFGFGVVSLCNPVGLTMQGIAGVTSGILGPVSFFMTSDVPTLMELELENGSKLYLYLPANVNPYV